MDFLQPFRTFHPRFAALDCLDFSFTRKKTIFRCDTDLLKLKQEEVKEELMCMCTILAEFQGDKKMTKCPQREIRAKNNILERHRETAMRIKITKLCRKLLET